MWHSIAISLLSVFVLSTAARAQDTCTKADFEAVVDDAAAALRDLNGKHRPTFQERLRQLKDKRGWDHDTFMREAAPFVQDERISEFDQQSADFLARISSLGAEGAAAVMPDCKLLVDVRSNMTGLVEAQKAKWTYMFDKLERELAQ